MTTFPHNLTTLDYLPLKNIFFPAEMPSNKLMILLHGRGGKAEDFSWIPDFFAFEDMHYILLNAPNSYNEGYSWYDDDFNDIEDLSKLLTQTFDILFEKDFNASQSFLFGFSQGAMLTFEFGARYTKKLAGYIAISGHLHNPSLLLQEMNRQCKDANWLCTHGIEDEVLDFETASLQIKTLQQGGLAIKFLSYEKGHTIEREEMQRIHHWIQETLASLKY